MKKIAIVLMEFGFGFEYEHRGSDGEKIISFELGLEVSNQNGKIYYSCSTPTEIFEENESEFLRLAEVTKQECIMETSSF